MLEELVPLAVAQRSEGKGSSEIVRWESLIWIQAAPNAPDPRNQILEPGPFDYINFGARILTIPGSVHGGALQNYGICHRKVKKIVRCIFFLLSEANKFLLK